MITLTLIHDAPTESGKVIPKGTAVEYTGHVPGGMVSIRLADGSKEVIHPNTTKELGIAQKKTRKRVASMLGAKGGRSKSPAKIAAAKLNGMKGGRPPEEASGEEEEVTQ